MTAQTYHHCGDTTPAVLDVPTTASELLDRVKLRDVIEFMSSKARTPHRTDLRASIRSPFPVLLRMTPADRHGTLTGPTTTVVGKDISSAGLGFYHHGAVEAKYIVVQFDEAALQGQGLLTRLVWCRFRQDGWYDNGGEFLGFVDLTPTAG